MKSKGAKAVYIPRNRNGNQKKFAIITFASAKEAKAAQTTPIWYNNHRVNWENPQEKEIPWREESRGRKQEWSKTREEEQEIPSLRRCKQEASRGRKREIESIGQAQDAKIILENIKNDKTKEESTKKREEFVETQAYSRSLHMEEMLRQILDRLNRIEETQEAARENLANRS